MGAGIGNQASGKGDRSIKRVDRSYMTAEKITTNKAYRSIMDQQQAHFLNTEGNRGYGSLIRAEGNQRGSDSVAGGGVRIGSHGGGGGGVGKSYDGKFKTIVRDAIGNNVIRESVLNQTAGRKGLQKKQVRSAQGNQQATVNAAPFAPVDKTQRGDVMASGTVSTENFLRVSVKPTKVYSTLGQYSTNSSFGITTGNSIKENYIKIEGNSGKDTQGKFDTYQPEQVGGITERITVEADSRKKFLPRYETEHFSKLLNGKITVEADSGKQFLPRYETEHFSRDLTPKLAAKNIFARSSTTRNNARITAENFIRLTPNKPNVEIKAPINRIQKNVDTHRDDYKLRHSKPKMENFSAGSNPSIPIF
jgi:hypothetical protein